MSLTTNLVAYYTFDSSNSNDSTSNGYNGTDTNTSYSSSYGKINVGVECVTAGSYNSGSQSRINLPSGITSIFSGTNAWSINCWFYPTGNIPGYQNGPWVLICQDSGGHNVVTLEFYNIDGTTGHNGWIFGRVDASGGNDYYAGSTQVAAGAWQMVTLTYDGSTMTCYINASSYLSGGSTRSVGTPASGVLNTHDNGYNQTTYMDEVGFWSRALSSSEVTTLYNSGSGKQYPFSTAWTTTLTESLPLSDTIKRTVGRSLTDSLPLSDTVSAIRALPATLTDGLVMADTIAKTPSRSLSEVTWLQDITKNLITNPSFETGLTSWSSYANGGTFTATLSQDSSTSYSGSNSMKIVGGGTGGQYYGAQYTMTGLVVGAYYTVSTYAKGTLGTEDLNLYVANSANSTADYTLSTSFSRYSLTFQATSSSLYLYLRSSTAGATWWVDAVQLQVGWTPTTYFDGSLTGASWEGTAGASISDKNIGFFKVLGRMLTESMPLADTYSRVFSAIATLTENMVFTDSVKKLKNGYDVFWTHISKSTAALWTHISRS